MGDFDMSFGINVDPKIVEKTKTLGHNAVLAGMTGVAEFVEAGAKEDVPVDTGALQESIEAKVIEAKEPMVILSAGNDDVDYAIYPELGTSKMPAQPYMRPQLEKKGEIMAAFEKSAKEGM